MSAAAIAAGDALGVAAIIATTILAVACFALGTGMIGRPK